MVFSKILQTRGCNSGFYCPDAFSEVACPPQRPYSPPNSGSLANCTCAMGTYLVAANQSCVPCTASCTAWGMYLPVSQCLGRNGATSDATCVPCTNLPPANAQSTDSGIEIVGSGGFCPFQCNAGYQLHSSGVSQSTCAYTFACVPVPRLPSTGSSVLLYYSAGSLPLDYLRVDKGVRTCTPVLGLTNALVNPSASPQYWQPQKTSCVGLCVPSQPLQLCYAANASQIIDPQNPWYGLASPLNCTPCAAPLLPVGAQPLPTPLGPASCQPTVMCGQAAHYFNSTAWACQSCKALEAQVCPNNTRLRGMGCLGNFRPFSLDSPASDCVQCTLSMPDPSIEGQTFLNYNSVNGTPATGGCAIERCAPLQRNYFWSVPCAGPSLSLSFPWPICEDDVSAERRRCRGDPDPMQNRAMS